MASEPTCIRCGTHRGTFHPGPIHESLICEECFKKEAIIPNIPTRINAAVVEAALVQLIRVLPLTTRTKTLRLLVKAFHPDGGGSNELMMVLSNVTERFRKDPQNGRSR